MALVEQIIIQDGATATLRQIDSALDATAQRVTRLSNDTVVSSRATQAAVRNLGFQLNDVATSLASGASPFQVLAQQAGQFQVAFAQGGGVSQTISAFTSSLRSMITPATAAAAAGVGLAGGLALVTLRAREAAREVETYNRIVATSGRGSPASISSIQAENQRLASSGVSVSDATAMRAQIARSSTFNASETSRLMQTAANVGQFFGEDAAKGLDRLEQAAKGGAEGMAKLAFEVGAVSRETAQAAIDTKDAADSFEKMSDAATALERHLQDYAAKNIDPISKAATELSTNWSSMLTTLGNTINFEGIVVGAFGAMGAAVDHLAARVQNLKNFLTFNWSAIGPKAPASSPEWRFPIPGAVTPVPPVPEPKPTPPGTQSMFLPPVKVTAKPSGGGRSGGGGSSRAVADPNRGQVDFSGGGEAEADLRAETVQLEKQLALVQQETALQGQSAEHIEYQLALLKARQEVEKSGLDTTNETAASYLKSAEALAAGRLHLEQIQVESRRWDDAVRGLASTMENTLGNTIEDIFSGRKITDWGNQLRSIVGSVLSDIVKFTLIRPAIGTALGSLGFSSVAQQYGSFGGTSSSSPFSLGNISSVASLGNTAFGGSGGMLGGIGGWIDSTIGPALGFSSLPGAGVAGIPLASAGGLFGATTLSSVIPFVGLAAGLGFMLSGLFGNKRPSNASAGGMIDFSTGRIGSTFTGGNSQIDSSTQQLISQVSTFTKSLLDLTGGSLAGSVLLQGGVNTGFTADSTLAPFLGRFDLGKDPTQAAGMVQLALIRSLTGISDAMKTVLDQVTDPAAIEGALTFAAAYDEMKVSLDNFNAGIEDIANDDGVYAQAKKQVEDTFAGLIEQAKQYGLALEPINFGLEQALDTLWTEFTLPLQQFADSLRGGELSGLTASAQLVAANDNFNRTLALVQAGNADEIGNLVTYGQQAISLSAQAYGNAPQTAGLREDMLLAIDEVLADRSFATGTSSTPPGWIRVGESGPEWMMQSGGATILPSGVSPPGTDMARLESLLEQLVYVARAVGAETLKRLDDLIVASETDPVVLAPPARREVAA